MTGVGGSLGRVGAVLAADLRARMRRPSTALLVAAMALTATLIVPDPRSGRGLLQVGGRRALHTSEALAFATAGLLPIFVGLFGFYAVSRAVERDRETGLGPLVATTPVASAEYLLGKLLGSALLLLAVSGAFMAATMGMHLVRGEGPLKPVVYLAHYAPLALPAAVGVAAWALLFECVPGLSGRGGDVLYLLVWALSIPLAVQLGPDPAGTARLGPGSFLDTSGLGWLVTEVGASTGEHGFSIGSSPVDPSKPPLDFPGLTFGAAMLLRRSAALALPVGLFLVSVVAFRRFDPSRGGGSRGHGKRSLLGLLDAVGRLPARPLLALLDRASTPGAGGASLASTLLAEVALTFRIRPAGSLLVVAGHAGALVAPAAGLGAALLPALFVGLATLLADLPCREERSGTRDLVLAAPLFAPRLPLLKLGASAVTALLVVGAPAARLLATRPLQGASLLAGVAFTAALAAALGLATASPKAFLALFLGLWYVALNSGGSSPALDFAGWYGTATGPTVAGWLCAALVLGLAARVAGSRRLLAARG